MDLVDNDIRDEKDILTSRTSTDSKLDPKNWILRIRVQD